MSAHEVSLEERLMHIAIEQFGEKGRDGVGTRAIAKAAGAQMSSITYHFGSKDGLYLACARFIAEAMGARIVPALENAGASCGDDGSAVQAKAAVLDILDHFTTVMLLDDIAHIARFVVREQMSPSPAFEVLWSGIMSRVLARMGTLLSRIAGGRLTAEDAALRAIALVGQVIVFRFARATLMHATGWERITENEADAARRVVRAHAGAVLDDLERGDTP